jgi:hypothetical protein
MKSKPKCNRRVREGDMREVRPWTLASVVDEQQRHSAPRLSFDVHERLVAAERGGAPEQRQKGGWWVH